MIQTQSTISGRFQTVVPAVVRSQLDLKSGDKIIWRVIKKGGYTKILAEPRPKSWAQFSRGLGKQIWESVDIDEYIQDLRREWDEKS